MRKSSGIAIILGNKILLCHPTNSYWKNSYSIPKGHIEDGESKLDAALRECKEETGLDISRMIGRFEGPEDIEYKNKDKKPHKVVSYYVLRINSISEIGLESEIVPKKQLQIAEVDWAGFITKSEASTKMLWRLKGILNKI